MSFVTPFDLISTPLERHLSYIKLSRRHQSFKIPKSTLKMSSFNVYVSFLKETRICMRLAIYNTHIRLKYMNFCIATDVSTTLDTYFEIWVVWVVMQLTPSVVTTLSSTLTLHKAYK